MLRTSHFTVFVACLAFAFVGCSGNGGENTGQSRGAISQNDNGQGNGNGQGEDQDEDDEQKAQVQLISFDTNSDALTGTNLVTLQTNTYNLVFGTTQLFSANLTLYPTGPVKDAAAAYDTGLANHNQSQVASAISTYASLGGKASITFTQSGLTRTLTSFKPFN